MSAREKILACTQELFFKYGIHSVTMDDIAKHMGISKKTIYRSFKDKDEVVHTLIEEKLKQDKMICTHIIKGSSNVVEEVFSLMKQLSRMMGQVNVNIFRDLQKYHPNSWALFQKFKEDFILKSVEDTLKRGIKQSYIRPDVNPKILARLRMEEIVMGFNSDIFPENKFNFLEVQISLMEHFLYGICTLKGHKLINKYKQIVEEE